MRNFPNYGDFILIPIYIGLYVKFQFLRQNPDWPLFGERHAMITPPLTRQPVLLHCLQRLVDIGPIHSSSHHSIGILFPIQEPNIIHIVQSMLLFGTIYHYHVSASTIHCIVHPSL